MEAHGAGGTDTCGSGREGMASGSAISAPGGASAGAAAAADRTVPRTCVEAARMARQMSAGRASRMLARASSWFPSVHSRWVKSWVHAPHRRLDAERDAVLSNGEGQSAEARGQRALDNGKAAAEEVVYDDDVGSTALFARGAAQQVLGGREAVGATGLLNKKGG